MKKIPKFKSEKEMADFWATHSPLDYPGEFKEIKFKHRHEFEKKTILGVAWMPGYIQCKTCRKVSWPDRQPMTKKQKAHGCFGRQD